MSWVIRIASTLSKGGGVYAVRLDVVPLTLNRQIITLSPRS